MPRISRNVTAAGSPRVSGGCRRRRRFFRAPWCRCAASRTGSCIAPASAARCGRKYATAASGFSASPAASSISSGGCMTILKREARRDLQKAAQSYAEALGRQGEAAVDPRPVEPLGFVHVGGIVVVFLAADPGAALRARLSRRARGGASGRDESFAAVLEGGGAGSAAMSSAPRTGSTLTATICIATAFRTEQRVFRAKGQPVHVTRSRPNRRR